MTAIVADPDPDGNPQPPPAVVIEVVIPGVIVMVFEKMLLQGPLNA